MLSPLFQEGLRVAMLYPVSYRDLCYELGLTMTLTKEDYPFNSHDLIVNSPLQLVHISL